MFYSIFQESCDFSVYREAEVPSSRLLSRSGSNPPEAEPEKPLPRHSASSNGSSEGCKLFMSCDCHMS